MPMLKAIIVDDEESARDILASLLGRFCNDIDILATHTNLESAIPDIKKLQPDVVFLDIEMPKYAGYEIVDFFDKIDFEIVFITAYDQYALRAFDVAALDYLLKPIDIERLKQSIAKIRSKVNDKISTKQLQLLSQTIKEENVSQITIVNRGYRHHINVKDILAIEAQEAYSKIWLTSNETYIASKNLKHFEGILSDNSNFFRSHKSWLVNLDFLQNYSKTQGQIKLIGSLTVKLSRYRTEALETHLKTKIQ